MHLGNKINDTFFKKKLWDMAKQIIKHSHKSRVNMNFSLIGYAVITYQVDSVSNLSYFLNNFNVTEVKSGIFGFV